MKRNLMLILASLMVCLIVALLALPIALLSGCGGGGDDDGGAPQMDHPVVDCAARPDLCR